MNRYPLWKQKHLKTYSSYTISSTYLFLMQNNLFLLCPTDNLEPVINTLYNYENYFYTSLGNTFSKDIRTLNSLKKLIRTKSIGNIFFVLSSENKIILDALESQFFKNITGLEKLYKKIEEQKKHSEFWDNHHFQELLFSYYLNYKIKELSKYLGHSLLQSIPIKGKIYNQQENKFYPIYSNLICKEKFHFN
ncbi:Carbonic anhydrase [Zobellia roscoffensis]